MRITESQLRRIIREELGVEEIGFDYAAAQAAVKGEKSFKFGGEERPVKMSKAQSEKIVDEIHPIEFVSVGSVRTGAGVAEVVYDPEVTIEDTARWMLETLKSVPKRELRKSAATRIEAYDNPEDVTRRLDEVGIEQDELSNGAYDFRTGTIYACAWDGYRDSPRTLLHELGHSIVGADEEMAEAWYENYTSAEER